jgi:DNA-binding response OmpR family regulator
MAKKRVLIIEDELSIKEVYAEVLTASDFEVIEAEDGEVGLNKAKNEAWDLMLLDIMLPKKDGLEVLAIIKKDPKLQSKPVVLLTNLGRDSIVKEGFNLGAVDYLVKSDITPGDVVNCVIKYTNA